METQIGRHTLRIREPALYHIVMKGDMDADEMRHMIGLVLEVSKGRPHILVLGDLAEMGSITPEARKVAAAEGSRLPIRALAYYRASMLARATITLALGAMRLLSSTDCRFRFFATEAEASAWIEEQQRALYPEVPGGE